MTPQNICIGLLLAVSLALSIYIQAFAQTPGSSPSISSSSASATNPPTVKLQGKPIIKGLPGGATLLNSVAAFSRLTPTVTSQEPNIKCGALSQLGGPDLDRIHLLLSGVGGTIYVNNYLTGHPASTYFQQIGTVPTGNTPIGLEHSGNALRGAKGFAPTRLELESVDCTSRYGGSLRFHFKQQDDIQYEATDGIYLWDLQDFAVDIYAVPNAYALNGPNRSNFVPTAIEFSSPGVTTYRQGRFQSSGQQLPEQVILDTSQPTALSTQLSQLQIGTDPIAKLSLGLVRALNRPLFSSQNVIVDAVHISDGRLDVVTRQGVKVADVWIRIGGIDVNTERGKEEFWLSIYEGSGYGYTWRAVARDIRLNQNQSSAWFKLGSYAITPTCSPKVFTIHYDLVERDDAPLVGGSTIFTSPDYFDVRSHTIALGCSQLTTLPVGLGEEGVVEGIEIHKQNMVYNLQGTMTISYRTMVALR